MIELYGRANSTNVVPVLWCLAELGRPYRRHDVGGSFGGADTPAFRAMNPNGRIPVLNDGGFVLWESNAIIRYLVEAYGEGTLRGADTRERALNDQWMEWFKTTLYPPFIALYQSFIRVEPERRDAERVAELATAVGSLLAVPEAELGRRTFLGGEQLGMGDIPLGAALYRYLSLPVARPALPALDRWFGHLSARASFRRWVMRPFGLSPAEFLALERAGTAADDDHNMNAK